MYEWFLMSFACSTPSLLVNFNVDHILECHSKPNNLVCNISFAKHDMQLACFRTSVGECVLPIERARLLEQACRSVMV